MKRKQSINSYNEIDDELIQRAFDADEEMPLPEDYILDEINDKSVDFLRSVNKERILLENKYSRINNTIEFEFSLNVDNNLSFQEIYDRLKITKNWITNIKEEFEYLRSNIESDHPQRDSSLPFVDIINKYKLHKQNLDEFAIPCDIIKSEISPYLTNKNCIKLISHFDKLFMNSGEMYIYTLMLWLYYILASLQTPLVDDDNSVLYQINKNILKTLLKMGEENDNTLLISLKIIHVVISEIFGQKVFRI